MCIRTRHCTPLGHRDLELRHDHDAYQERHGPRRLVRGRGGALDAVWWTRRRLRVQVHPFGGRAGGRHLGRRELAAGRRAGPAVRVPTAPHRRAGSPRSAYPDPAAGDATTPHAYFRAGDGSLAQTYLGASGWVTQELPGQPADNSNIVATATAGGAAVFYVDATGQLAESSEQSGTWTTGTLVPDGPAISPASLALADTAAGPVLFAVGPAGTIRAVSADGRRLVQPGDPGQDHGRGRVAGRLHHARRSGGRRLRRPARRRPGRGGRDRRDGGGSVERHWPARLARARRRPGGDHVPAAVRGVRPLGSFPQPPGSLTPSGPAEPLGTEAFYLHRLRRARRRVRRRHGLADGGAAGHEPRPSPGASAYPVAYEPMQLFRPRPAG